LRRATRNLIISIIVLLLLGIGLPLVSYVTADDSAIGKHILEPVTPIPDIPLEQTAALAASGVSQRYEAYSAAYANKKRASWSQVIAAVQYTEAEDMQVEKLEHQDGAESAVVLTGDSGVIHWDVDVEQDGLYHIAVRYLPAEGNSSSIERSLLIDGRAPFEEATRLKLSRVWSNELPVMEHDAKGNDLRPRQVERPQWQESVLQDAEGYYKEPFSFYFSKGKHRISLVSLREPVILDSIKLYQEAEVPAYDEVFSQYEVQGYKAVEGIMVKVQGEDATLKSNPSLYPINDRSSPANEPYHATKIRMNAIGGANWKLPGQWIQWDVDIPEDGLYQFGMRYKQNTNRGSSVVRKLTIDGRVPFKEVEAMPFPYDGTWQIGMPGVDGEPYSFYLTKGKHQIKLELSMGEMAGIIRKVRASIQELNTLYLKVIMITSTVPDPFRDYELERKIPELKRVFKEQSEFLSHIADQMDQMVGGTSGSTTILRTTAYQLADLGDRTESLASRLKQFKDNVSALGTWLLTVNAQPLAIDYLFFKSPDVPLPSASKGWIGNVKHEVLTFLGSFTEEYGQVATASDKGKKQIEVWIASGRDQAQLLRSMIDNTFTPQTGIEVNLQLVSPQVVLPATLAGKGPDIALTQGEVINFAMRNALQDLTQFPDFEKVKTRFMPSAFTNLSYREGVYALPETQTFPMLFYRKDILEELKLDVPQTWEDMYRVIPELQKHNMELAMPFISVFETLLYQNGGQLYQGDGIATDLNSEIGIQAFRKWTELYTNYKLPIEFDFLNRFRTGEMPIGIADYTTYNFLTIFAPEIRGQWDFVPLPGTKTVDGQIRRAALSTNTGTVMFKNTENKEAAWTFLKWWTDADAQAMFGREMEAILGESARYAPANITALHRLAWSAQELKTLMSQFEEIVGPPAVPGGYSLDRHLNNAFYDVYNNGSEPRETLENYVRTINEEISVKRKEFGLPTK